MRVVVPSLAVLLSIFAGCAEDGAPAEVQDEEVFDELGGEATSSTGLIRGVVFDATITPIANATVSIQSVERKTTTNADGAFVIDDLDPGVYFLEVSKLGYTKVQQSADVEAGVERPAIVKVQLLADLQSLPSTELFTFEGFLQCGVGLGAIGLSTNPCAFTGSVNVFEVPVQRPVNFTQVEMVWDGTNVFGDGLSVGILIPGTISNFANSDGPSPRILPVGQEEMEDGLDADDYDEYVIRVFPGRNQPVSLVVEQAFTIYSTNFYGMIPDEGWAFITHGEHPVPV